MSHTAGASSTAGCQESGGELVELLAPTLRERRAGVVVEGSEGSEGSRPGMRLQRLHCDAPGGVGSASRHETEHERSREVDQTSYNRNHVKVPLQYESSAILFYQMLTMFSHVSPSRLPTISNYYNYIKQAPQKVSLKPPLGQVWFHFKSWFHIGMRAASGGQLPCKAPTMPKLAVATLLRGVPAAVVQSFVMLGSRPP